jgi:hypothetical protein
MKKETIMANQYPGQGRNIDVEAMAIIKSSAILNPDATLEMIMSTVNRLAALEPLGPRSAELETATFFGPWFCYTTSSEAAKPVLA